MIKLLLEIYQLVKFLLKKKKKAEAAHSIKVFRENVEKKDVKAMSRAFNDFVNK